MRLAVAVVLLSAVLLAQEPEAASLREAMPVLTHESADKSPYVVEGRFGRLWFRLEMRSAAEGFLVVGSLHDGKPFFVANGGTALVLDVADGHPVAFEKAGFELVLKAQGDELVWRIGTRGCGKGADSQGPIAVDIDTRTFFDQLVQPQRDKRGIFGVTKKGGVVRLQASGRVIVVGAPPQRSRADIRVLSTVPPKPRPIRIPAGALRLDTEGHFFNVVPVVMRSVLIGVGLADPTTRPRIADKVGPEFDWHKARKQYKRLAWTLTPYGKGPATGSVERASRAILVDRAMKLLEEAATHGDVRAQTELGRRLVEREDRGKARKWLTLAAEAEHGEAQALLGGLLVALKEKEAGLLWLQHAVHHDEAAAATVFGGLAERGEVGGRNLKEAEDCFALAAKLGYAPGQYHLGRLVKQQERYEEAARWYELAAKSGHRRSALELGYALQLGKGRKRDVAAGAEWIRQAALAGLPEAQGTLSSVYGQGLGVPQDWAMTYVWASIAVENGQSDYVAVRNSIRKLMSGGQAAAAAKELRELRARD